MRSEICENPSGKAANRFRAGYPYDSASVGEVLQMLDSRADRQSGGYVPAAQPIYPSQVPSAPTAPRATPASKPAAEAPMDNFDDDIPF